jgi:hypothetical protein
MSAGNTVIDMDTDTKLIPVLREGVAVVQMVLFKELKSRLSGKYPAKNSAEVAGLAGAVINELFGTSHTEAPSTAFKPESRKIIDREIDGLGDFFPELKIPLTDALRVQFLCDSLEGINSESILERARARGVLLMNREIPFPRNFMEMSRNLGVSHRILSPKKIVADA